jgi:hypothetical protein
MDASVASVEVDGGKMMTVPRAILPRGVQEGQILRVTIEIDEAATAQALAASAAQVRKHERPPNDPGGDITL